MTEPDILRQLVEQSLQNLEFSGPDSLYEPVRYTLGLGGKRLRPVLALMACEMSGGQAEEALPVALALELFHNFTLLHDDIMDRATLRRGQQPVYLKFGINAAILSGDVMMVKAWELLGRLPDALLPRALQQFNRAARLVCEGQQLDLDYEKRPAVTVEEYLEMIRMKTAELLAASLSVGALAGGGDEQSVSGFYECGIQLGLSFQLQDDLLDTFGRADTFGKQQGGDILNNKKTYLLVRALEKAGPPERGQLEHWLNEPNPNPAEKIWAVTELFRQLNIPADLTHLRDDCFRQAMDHFKQLPVDPDDQMQFVRFAESLLQRES